MNRDKRKKREWVKTAIIVFLSVMLVLTFFSNTIMNYSLPEVAAQYVQSGSITAKIRGNGVVESGDPYNVMVKQTRKVMSVAVREGDTVQKGDVILYLEDTESEELKAARKALEAAQEAYDLALLAEDINAGIINNAQKDISTTTYRRQIDAAQAAVKVAQAEVDSWQAKYDEVSVKLEVTPSNGADVREETAELNEAKKNWDNAKLSLTSAQNSLAAITAQITYLESLISKENTSNNAGTGDTSGSDANSGTDASGNDISGGSTDASTEGDSSVTGNTAGSSSADEDNSEIKNKLAALREEEKKAKQILMISEKNVNDTQLVYDVALAALENKKTEGDNAIEISQLTKQQAIVRVNLEAAQKTLADRQQALTELTGNINKTLTLETLYNAVVEAQVLVDEEVAKTTDAIVTSDIAGTITRINTVAGKEVSAAEPVAIIQPEGKGYTMSFTVTNEQARRLSVGDKAELINSWYYDEMDITLASIRPDTTNPGKQKLLTFDVAGSVTAGQSLNVSVGQKSANYDLIVPNSAIREDNNGKFVLIVESKSSPLGNRYIAKRADIEVLASDDTQSAISGALYGYEFVITTSTKPVEAGQQVRLAEN